VQLPTYDDVLRARRLIGAYLPATPLREYAAINELVGARVFVKHENHQPTNAFKVRGGINLVAGLGADERARGLVTASTGNHGQSIAYAARLFGVRVRVVVPEQANYGKVASMRALGAEVVFRGAKFDDARIACEEMAEREGLRYVHSGNEPHLIAGVATHAAEMLDAQPDLDAIVVPVGGGSGAAGACLVAHAVSPRVRVIAVQSAASPAAYESWRAHRLVERPNTTMAEGLATATAFILPQTILWEHLREFVLVSDEDILHAAFWLLERAHTLAEPAGAASLAAACQLRHDLGGLRVGIICSGSNATPEQIRMALEVGRLDRTPAGAGTPERERAGT
jgi:threonine dehydratase